MKSNFFLILTVFLISSLFAIQQSFAEETLDFENCNGILSIDEVKNVIGDIDITVDSRGVIPVDAEPGLKTFCASTFESSGKTIGMTIIVMDSTDAAITQYEKNLDSFSNQDFEIREYLTFWNNFDIVLNDQGMGSVMVSQYDKFFISLRTGLEENKTLADVEQLRVLSTIVQKKILDLPDVPISPPNPTPDIDEGPTTDESPPKPGPAPIEMGEILSPIKQVAQGIDSVAVVCNEELVLIIKHNGSPACVRPDTAEILEERGWGGMPPPCCKDMPHILTTEAVLGIAEEFIKSSATFAFDGIEETLSLELVAIRESFPEQYVIEADFDSLHGGYGDRTDEMVIQVITPHSMNLVVINGEVTSALLDGKWDELNQLQLPWTPTKGPSESPDTVSHGGPAVDYVSLIDNLRANDATVNPEGEIEQPFFSVTGFSIQVNGASVQVFEYNTSEDAEADASLVSSDGSSIGTSMPFWVDDPHFYYKEKIIVLYVGDNPAIEELLESVLGSQFAGR